MENLVGRGFITLIDLSDPIVSAKEPPNPMEDMLWLDISQTPPVLKVYNNGKWTPVSADTGGTLPDSSPVGGYYGGDFAINKNHSGGEDDGSIQILGGLFIHPNGGKFTVPDGKVIRTDLNKGFGRYRYILFIGHDSSRFGLEGDLVSKHFIETTYEDKKWFYYKTDDTPIEFKINDNDCIVAKVMESKEGEPLGLSSIVRYYEDENSVFEALTNGGEIQGLYKKDGLLYVNAEFIATGKIVSRNKAAEFDLDRGTFRLGGTGDHNYSMRFDGTDLQFANGSIKWENLDDASKENLRKVTVVIDGGVRTVYVQSDNSITTNPKPYSVRVLLGSEDITDLCSGFKWKASGIYTGSASGGLFIPDKGAYTVNESYIEVVAYYANKSFAERVYLSVSKEGADGKDGIQGEQGPAGEDGQPGIQGPPGPILDWIQEWDGTKTEIGGTQIVTPKIFAGTKDENGNPTGVAIGDNIFGEGNEFSGIAGYNAGEKLYHFGVNGEMIIGRSLEDNHVFFDGKVFSIQADSLNLKGKGTVATDSSLKELQTSITTDMGVISNKVTSIEDIQGDHSKRINSAEEKITDTAITNVIKEAVEVDGTPVFAQTTTVKSSIDGLEVKFSTVGGDNLLTNSTFESGMEGWYPFHWRGPQGTVEKVVGSGNNWIPEGMTGIRMAIPNNTGASSDLGYGVGQTFKLKADTNYIVSGYSASHRTSKLVLEIKSLKDGVAVDNHFVSAHIRVGGGDHTIQGMGERWSIAFHTPNDKDITDYMLVIWIGESTDHGNPVAWLSQLQVEEGHTKTPWKSKSNEVFYNLTTIGKNGVKVSMDDGEGSQGYTLVSHDGFTVKKPDGGTVAHFGQGNTAQIGDLTVSGKVHNRHLLKWNEGKPDVLYVAPYSSGDGTGRDIHNKSNSVNNALEWLRLNYGCYSYQQDLRVSIEAGSYNEHVYIGGWIGTGVIFIDFDQWATLYGSITVEENTMFTYVRGGRSWNSNSGCVLESRRQEAVIVRNCNCRIEGFRSRPSSYPNYGGDFIWCQTGANVWATHNDVVKYYSFVVSDGHATFHSLDNRGDTYYLSSRFLSGELYFLGVCHPISDSDYFDNVWNTHLVHHKNDTNSVWAPKPEPEQPPPPPPPPPPPSWGWFENTFSLSNLRTYTEGSGSGTTNRVGEWGQGKWGSYKSHRGYADMGNAPSSWCSGGRNFTVWLTMTRLNTSHGYSDGPTPKLKEPNGNFWNTGRSFARGATHTIQLPASIANAIVNGSMKTLEMWAGASTSDYSFYNNTSIRIKCEKQI